MRFRPFDFWWGWTNGLAFAFGFVGIFAGLLTYGATREFSGDSDRTKGIAWLASGSVMFVFDIIYRVRMCRINGKRALIHPETGGWSVILPMWIWGLVLVVAAAFISKIR